MKRSSITLSVISGLLFSATAVASTPESAYYESSDSGVFTTLQVGTLGPGLNIGYQFNPMFDIRANVNGLKYNRSQTVNDVKYDGSLRMLTAGVLLDYYPFENGFRMTAGGYYNGNKITGNGSYTKDVYGLDPNDYGYTKASVDYKKFAPYVGFGYQTNSPDSNWLFTADIGVLYQGKARVHNQTVCYSQTVCTVLQSQIREQEAEQTADIQDKVDKLKWYPVASIGIGYRF